MARFGWRLYRTFFKTYTEKVWGVKVSEMPSDWAAQRIKNLDLRKAVINAILPKRKQTEITSLIEEFQYPKFGPGMMWEVCAEKVVAAGGTVHLSSPLTQIHVAEGRAQSVTYVHDGAEVDPGGLATSSRPCPCASWCMRSRRPRPPRCWPPPTGCTTGTI